MQDHPTHDFFQENRLNYRKSMFINEMIIEKNMNLSDHEYRGRIDIFFVEGIVVTRHGEDQPLGVNKSLRPLASGMTPNLSGQWFLCGQWKEVIFS